MEKRPLDIWCVRLNSTGPKTMRLITWTVLITHGIINFDQFKYIKERLYVI